MQPVTSHRARARIVQRAHGLAACALALALFGCAGQKPRPSAPAQHSTSSSAPAHTPPATRRDGGATAAPDTKPRAGEPPRLPTAFRRRRHFAGPPPPTGSGVAGAHILITYKGALRAKARTPRDRATARALAATIARKLCPRPTWKQFAAAARKYSDGPSRRRGGWLGKWPIGRMVPPFDAAVAKLHFNECRGPVSTSFGFHVVLRFDPAQMPKR